MSKTMKIFMRALGGTFAMEVDGDSPVKVLLGIASKETGIPVGELRISVEGKQLKDNVNVSESGIRNGSTCDVKVKLAGGGLEDSLARLAEQMEERSRMLEAEIQRCKDKHN